jgi:hypothetical protein
MNATVGAASVGTRRRRRAGGGLEASWVTRRGEACRGTLADIARLSPSDFTPVRVPHNTRHQSQRPSLFLFSTTGEHVWCRSRLAERNLLHLDFDPQVAAVCAEPFLLHHSPRTLRGRAPDFLGLTAAGERVVFDVVGPRRAQQKATLQYLRRMSGACDALGWEHRVLGEPDPVATRNLYWLKGYSAPPPFLDEFASDLLRRCATPQTLGRLVAQAGPSALVRPVLFHLLWTRALSADLSALLSQTTLITRGQR